MDNNPIGLNDPSGLGTDATTHTTKSGDTYGSLAKKYGVSVTQLRKWNGYKDTEIPIGVELKVADPSVVKTQVTGATPPTVAEANEHIYSRNNEDMSDVGKSAKAESNGKTTSTTETVEGAPRNSQAYWNKRLSKNDPALSSGNTWKINNGLSPRVDEQWIKYNPTHAAYKNQVLVHHHINQGEIATAIPEGVHQKYFKQLHPIRTANEKAAAKVRSTGRAGRFTKGVGGLYNMTFILLEVFSDNPHSTWNSTFGNGTNANQIYSKSDGGYYMMIQKHNIMNSNGETIGYDATVIHYSAYGQDENGKYIGIGETGRTLLQYRNDGTSKESLPMM